jgi:hypothetical protein
VGKKERPINYSQRLSKKLDESDRTRFVAATCRNCSVTPLSRMQSYTTTKNCISDVEWVTLLFFYRPRNPSFDDTRMLCGQDEAANKYKMPHHGQNNIKYAQLLRGLELQATGPSQAQLPSRSDPQRVVLSKLMAYRSPYSVSGDAERRAPTDLT